MEADREFVWTKVPGGYRVVVETKERVQPRGYVIKYSGGVPGGVFEVEGWNGEEIDGRATFTFTRT